MIRGLTLISRLIWEMQKDVNSVQMNLWLIPLCIMKKHTLGLGKHTLGWKSSQWTLNSSRNKKRKIVRMRFNEGIGKWRKKLSPKRRRRNLIHGGRKCKKSWIIWKIIFRFWKHLRRLNKNFFPSLSSQY